MLGLSWSPSSIDHPLNKRLLFIFTLNHRRLIIKWSLDINLPLKILVSSRWCGAYLMQLRCWDDMVNVGHSHLLNKILELILTPNHVGRDVKLCCCDSFWNRRTYCPCKILMCIDYARILLEGKCLPLILRANQWEELYWPLYQWTALWQRILEYFKQIGFWALWKNLWLI